MKIEDAVFNVDKVCAVFKGSRDEHAALLESIRIITEALEPKKKDKKKDEK